MWTQGISILPVRNNNNGSRISSYHICEQYNCHLGSRASQWRNSNKGLGRHLTDKTHFLSSPSLAWPIRWDGHRPVEGAGGGSACKVSELAAYLGEPCLRRQGGHAGWKREGAAWNPQKRIFLKGTVQEGCEPPNSERGVMWLTDFSPFRRNPESLLRMSGILIL